jgi:multidrug resistance efflux pump
VLNRVHQTYGYCLAALNRGPRRWTSGLSAILQGKYIKPMLILTVLAMLIPVRLSALAPAEVVALTSMAVAAPQDGVISTFHVQPNANVKTGDKLFSMDDSALSSRREVARRSLAVARADLLVAQQRAFDDLKSKGDLAAAVGRVNEKESELALADGFLDRVAVRAERDGIAVFGDPNDWLGRPVQTGERVMQLADPKDAGVLVWLPVADALNLEPGAPMKLFLHTQPLSPLSATLLQTSYQAVLSPEGVSAYRLRGHFDADTQRARIGLSGTARISGDWALLGYYLFRRPIAACREWLGL